MLEVTREVTVDVVNRSKGRTVLAKQNDSNSRFLTVHIQENGKNIDIDSTATVTMNVQRPDGSAGTFYGSVNEGGTVRVTLTAWILEQAGMVSCDISILSGDSVKLTTMTFYIEVEAAVYSDESFIATQDYSVIVDLLNRTTIATEKAEHAAENSEQLRKDCENATVAASRAAAKASTVLDDVREICRPRAGFIYPLAMDTVPDGFLLCDGTEYSIDDYTELYNAIGNTYGGEPGSTFCVPNLATRVPVGAGTGYELGATGGEETHRLATSEMPVHRHLERIGWNGTSTERNTLGIDGKPLTHYGNGSGSVGIDRIDDGGTLSGEAGGGQAHNNMQPYTVVNYIIATGRGDSAGYVANAAPGIADDAVSVARTWSSRNIVDKMCPTFRKEGSKVAVCVPVEGYPLDVVVHIECTQEGEDEPSPENVRPITGHSGVVLKHCGKNLFDKDSFKLTAGRYVASAGSLTNYNASSNYACTEGFIPVTHLQGKEITLNHPPVEVGGSNPKMVFYTAADGETAIAEGVTNGYKTTVPKNAKFMRFSCPKKYADGTQIQIEIGGAVTDYEPYNGNEISVAFGGTIYKGEFDIVTGLLRVTHKGVAMGELEWSFSGANECWVVTLDDNAASTDGAYVTDALCSVYAIAEGDFINNTVTLEKWTDSATGKDYCDAVVADSRFGEGDTEAFCAYLNEAGAVLVYPLETPEIVQLNAQQVVALQGVNTLGSNAGNIDIVGRADPIAIIEELTKAIISLGGKV